MKSETINQWMTLGANIGVIAGILFLGFELQQNNDLMESQARFNDLQIRSDA